MLFLIVFGPISAASAQTIQTDKRISFYAGADASFGKSAADIIIQKILLADQIKDNAILARAKFYLMQGQVELARYELSAFDRTNNSKLGPVIMRYRATADFLQGNWASALTFLEDPALNRSPHYSKICTLKVLTKIALRQRKTLAEDWDRCVADNYSEAQTNDMVWMDTIVRMVAFQTPGTSSKAVSRYSLISVDNETLKRVVKLALYLNVESLIVESIDKMDMSVARDEELRALLAHVLFRQGHLARAWKFIEGDTGVNVENIRGNIWLLRGNLEIAFAHFNLALNIKANSHNAAERALPVAWALKQWKRGQELTELMDVHEKNHKQLQALSVAFAIELEDFPLAKKKLERLNNMIGADTVLEVDQLSTYVALKTKDQRGFVRHGQRACAAGDMTYCWALMAQMTWEDVTPLLTNNESSVPVSNLARGLAAAPGVAPFTEEDVYIDQRDIDELDDNLIKLVRR